jgi:hypothetical protein
MKPKTPELKRTNLPTHRWDAACITYPDAWYVYWDDHLHRKTEQLSNHKYTHERRNHERRRRRDTTTNPRNVRRTP